MAVDASKVRVGLTGAISKAPHATVAPTTAGSSLNVAFVDSGAISEDGVTVTLPDGGDRTPIKIWQNGAQVRVLRSSSDDSPTVSFTMLETNKTAVETYFEAAVDDADGSFEVTVGIPDPFAYVLDVLDGANHHRFHVPSGVKASVGDLVYKNDEPIGYQVTLDCDYDTAAGYNLKGWMTDLVVDEG